MQLSVEEKVLESLSCGQPSEPQFTYLWIGDNRSGERRKPDSLALAFVELARAQGRTALSGLTPSHARDGSKGDRV